MNYDILVYLLSILIMIVGFIVAVVFFVIARFKTDIVTKKKFDRIAIWSFLSPILLIILGTIILNIFSGGANKNSATNSAQISCNLTVPVGSSSTIKWDQYCDKEYAFGFYYPDGWTVQNGSFNFGVPVRILIVTSPTINNLPGYQGQNVQYEVAFGDSSKNGTMVLQSSGFTVLDSSGKASSVLKLDQSVIQDRSEPVLGNGIISSFKDFRHQ